MILATRGPSLIDPKNPGPKSGTILRLRRASGGLRTSDPSPLSGRPRGADEQRGKVENQKNQIGSVYLPPIKLLKAKDAIDDEVDAIEITFLLPLFPQTAPIDEGITHQCLQIVDLGFRRRKGR